MKADCGGTEPVDNGWGEEPGESVWASFLPGCTVWIGMLRVRAGVRVAGASTGGILSGECRGVLERGR